MRTEDKRNITQASHRGATNSFAVVAALAFTCSLSFAAPPSFSRPEAPLSRFNAANEAYKAQEYDVALQIYEALIGEGAAEPVVYYDAGCALAQLGRTGRAVAMFERALKHDPRLADARRNLKMIAPAPDDGETFFLLLPFRELYRRFTAGEFFALAAVGWWLCGMAGAAWLLARRPRIKTAALALAGLGLATAFFFGGFFVARAEQARWKEAVVVADQTLARTGPSEEWPEQDILREGVKVRLLEAPREGWVKARIPGGRLGYLPQKSLEMI